MFILHVHSTSSTHLIPALHMSNPLVASPRRADMIRHSERASSSLFSSFIYSYPQGTVLTLHYFYRSFTFRSPRRPQNCVDSYVERIELNTTLLWWRGCLFLCGRNEKKENTRRFWARSSTPLSSTSTSSCRSSTALSTSPGTWRATPRGCKQHHHTRLNFAHFFDCSVLVSLC